LDKLKANVEGRSSPTTAGTRQRGSDGFSLPKTYGMQNIPGGKEPQSAYAASVVSGLTATGQPYASASAQATYPSFDGSQVYTASQLNYNQTYGTATAPPKQLPSTPLSATITYSTPSAMSYYTAQDSSATATTTPAVDWMRWSQANLNPFAQHAQQEYMTPTAANTLMSMGDSRTSASGAPGATPEHNNQWPLSYYSGGQFATSHPG
jgi:hypothetical protein